MTLDLRTEWQTVARGLLPRLSAPESLYHTSKSSLSAEQRTRSRCIVCTSTEVHHRIFSFHELTALTVGLTYFPMYRSPRPLFFRCRGALISVKQLCLQQTYFLGRYVRRLWVLKQNLDARIDFDDFQHTFFLRAFSPKKRGGC